MIKMRKIKSKKAYYYSLDALIAVVLILAVLFVIKPINKQKTQETTLPYDAIEVLSSLKNQENKTLLEQIAESYVRGSPEAEQLAKDFLLTLSPEENIGIWIGSDLIASHNSTPFTDAKDVWTAREIVSGLEKGRDVKGYSARAFLSRANQIDYFYFGGYIGDGNITIKANYNGVISSALMEIAVNKDFSLYINDYFIDNYQKTTPVYSPQTYSIPSDKLIYFHEGDNLIKIAGDNLYIAGGYLKISYNDTSFSYRTKKFFPGIEGVINIYDSFYVPSVLQGMEVFLHYSSPYRIFLNIGNKTVYEGNGSQEVKFSPSLNYEELSGQNIPIRLGLYETIRRGNADVIIITDLSGSMHSRIDNDLVLGTERTNCNDPLLYNPDTKRISLAKCLDKMVIDMILNASGNRVGLSAFYGRVEANKGLVYNVSMTNNSDYLKEKVEGYSSSEVGNNITCVCCAINTAYKILQEQSNTSRQKFVIVMSDGIATHQCGSGGADECRGTRTGMSIDDAGLWRGSPHCFGGLDNCDAIGGVFDCQCPSDNANWSSCRLKNDLNARVYSVGFGPVSTCTIADRTLRNIATCGGGNYYTSNNPEILREIYEGIAQEILDLSFIEQVSNVTGGSGKSILYPDSYISLNYQPESIYGLVITSESLEFGNYISEGSFNIPSDATPLEAIAVSYSASKWTDKVSISNQTSESYIFNLSYYGSNYLSLGDPYFVYIPKEKIGKGENKVKITTAISPANLSGGSPSNKVIFTLLKQALGYSPIKPLALGCIWTIEFFDFTNSTIKIPGDYNGTDTCNYSPGNIDYNMHDAINQAAFQLISSLDFDSNGLVDIKFSQQDLQISATEISGIPYTHYSEVQVRVWR